MSTRQLRTVIATPIVMLILGCTANVLQQGSDSQAIGHYAIPKALLELKVKLKYPEAALTNASALTAGSVSMSVETVNVELVPEALIPVHYDPSAVSSDAVTLDVNERGFLTSVAVDVEDKTPAFAAAIVDIAKLGVKIDKYPDTVLTITNNVVTQEFHFFFDPYGTGRTLDPIPGVTGDEIRVTVASNSPSSVSRVSNIATHCKDKICYPALVSRMLTFSGPVGTLEERLVVIPDPQLLFEVDFRRAAAVKKTVKADFSNGILSKVTLNKPSEALSITSIPIDVLTEIISIPTELIQLKIDTSKKDKELVNAQKDLLEAQQALIEAIQKAKEAAAQSDNSQGNY